MGLDLSPYFWGLVFPNLGCKAYVGIVLELWTYRKPPVSHFKVCQNHFETSKTFKKDFGLENCISNDVCLIHFVRQKPYFECCRVNERSSKQ